VTEPKEKRSGRAGCAALAVLVIAAVLGVGMFFGQRKEASLSPCERYARTVYTALDNCHSGVNRDREFHRQYCEQNLTVTEQCLEEIREISIRDACRELEHKVQSFQFCRE
jgi:hypothetical protein